MADNLFGADLPTVDSGSATALVSWQAAKNAAGNLVIGSTVANAENVAGVTGAAASAINALMTSDSPLAGTVQSLS